MTEHIHPELESLAMPEERISQQFSEFMDDGLAIDGQNIGYSIDNTHGAQHWTYAAVLLLPNDVAPKRLRSHDAFLLSSEEQRIDHAGEESIRTYSFRPAVVRDRARPYPAAVLHDADDPTRIRLRAGMVKPGDDSKFAQMIDPHHFDDELHNLHVATPADIKALERRAPDLLGAARVEANSYMPEVAGAAHDVKLRNMLAGIAMFGE